MASINYAAREISVKIVYYGPGLSGKTTNLQVIHRKVPPEFKSDMVSLATETDRTLFFDFLPLDLGKIKGFSTKFQLYTVPGQVYYNATRKLVLRGVDGIVFVADSAPDKIQENLESFQNLEENLAEYGYQRENIPIILQYNKRDLPNAMTIEELQQSVNKYNLPFTEAVANKGKGVFDSLKLIGKIVIDFLNKKYSRPSRPMAAPAPNAGMQQQQNQMPQRMAPGAAQNQAGFGQNRPAPQQQQFVQPQQPPQQNMYNTPQGNQYGNSQGAYNPQAPYQPPQQLRQQQPPMRPPVQQNPQQMRPMPQQQQQQQAFMQRPQQPMQQAPGMGYQAPQQPMQQRMADPFQAPQHQQGMMPPQGFQKPQQPQFAPPQPAYQAPAQQDIFEDEISFEPQQSQAPIDYQSNQMVQGQNESEYLDYGSINLEPNRDMSLDAQANQGYTQQQDFAPQETGKSDLDLEIEKYQREIEEKQRKSRTQGGGNPATPPPATQQPAAPGQFHQPARPSFNPQGPQMMGAPAQQQKPFTPPPIQPARQQDQNDYDVYNIEMASYQQPQGNEQADMQGQEQSEDDAMFFTSVDPNQQKKPVKRPINPRNRQQPPQQQQQKGFLSKFFNKDAP